MAAGREGACDLGPEDMVFGPGLGLDLDLGLAPWTRPAVPQSLADNNVQTGAVGVQPLMVIT